MSTLNEFDDMLAMFEQQDNTQEIATVNNSALQAVIELEKAIVQMETQLAEQKKKRDEFITAIEQGMNANGLTKFETEQIRITLVAETTAVTFDSKKFKADHPELAKDYEKVSTRKGYVKLTLK